jgi:hypothetical protein
VRLSQEIALNLLKKYVERYYKREREAYEAPRREYVVLTEGDPNFIEHYQVIVRQTHDYFLPKLKALQEELADGELADLQLNHLHALNFDQHLYSPLVHLGSKDLEIKPVPLSAGEHQFVWISGRFMSRILSSLLSGNCTCCGT